MLRLTVAFIVVTLTGLPVLPAMCHVWCGSQTTTEFCHDEAVENGFAAVINERAECGALVTNYPFIAKDDRPVLHTVPFLPAASVAPTLSAASHTSLALHRPTAQRAPALSFVLRL
jgi:hypothetical protein